MKAWILLILSFSLLTVSSRAQDLDLDSEQKANSDLEEMEKMENLELEELEKQISESPTPVPAPKSEVAPAPTPIPVQEEQLAQPEPAPAAPEPIPAPQQIVETPEPAPVASDDPDESFETRMAQIYEDFFKMRTSDGEWQKVVGDRSEESYVVQSGDTLWDLSEVLFGNGHFWSKLWAENRNFTNPHSIEINDRIVFVSGELSAEPLIRVSGTEHENDDTPEPPIPFQSDVDIPRAAKGKFLRRIPPSLPENTLEFGNYDNDGFELKSVARFHLDTTAPIQAYVTEDVPRSVAELVEIPDGAESVQPGVAVLVKSDLLNIGDVLTAFTHDKISGEGASIVRNLGEFLVVEKVDDNIFRLQSRILLHQVNMGVSFVQGGIPKADFHSKGSPTQGSLRLLGTEAYLDQTFFSDPEYVFLEGGTSNGISNGQTLRVRRVVSVRNPKTIDTTDATIGTVKIIRAENNFSTGILMESTDVIMPGDRTLGSGPVR